MEDSQFQKIDLPIYAIEQTNEENQLAQDKQLTNSSVVSQHLQKYLAILDVDNINKFKKHRQALFAKFQQQNLINMNQEITFNFKIVDFTTNYQYLLAEVQYNHCQFQLKIINIDEQSGQHKFKKCFFGNFSTVYQILDEGKKIAVKCSHYKSKNFSTIFKNVLLEYLSLRIVNTFNNGPKVINIYGFDLIVYKNCIQFSMEFCSHSLRLQTIQSDLKQALMNFHSLKMVHSDIKPENICFSQEYNRNVFIDYGLHRVVKEEIGQKTLSSFRGSLVCCSQQMKQCLLKGNSMVDLYYNDVICLKTSIEQINKKVPKQLIQNNQQQTNQGKMYLLIKLKYAILNLRFNKQSRIFIQYGTKLLKNNQIQSLQKFINSLICSEYYYSSQRQFQMYSIILQKLNGRFKKNITEYQNKNQKQSVFKKKMNQLKTISNSTHTKIGQYNIYIPFMSDFYLLKRQNIPNYIRLFSQNAQINSWKINLKDRDNIYNAFNRHLLNNNNFQILDAQAKMKKCFTFICNFIKAQHIMDDILFQILKNSLLSIILLQIYSQENLVYFFEQIISMQCTIYKLASIHILFLSCVEWTKYLNTIYCSCSLKDQIYKMIKYKQIKINQHSSKQQKFLLQLIYFLIQIIHKNPNERCYQLRQMLDTIQILINKNILNYYHSKGGFKQIITEYYVYFICFYQTGLYSTLFIDQLLKLQFYQQSEELDIFQYYQFTICFALSGGIKGKKELVDSIFSQLRKNFKCFQQFRINLTYQRQLFYLSDNKIIFNNIDLSKFKNNTTINTLFDAFQFYKSIVFKQHRSFTQYILDKQSLLSNMKLSQIYNIFKHIIAIANFEFSQYTEQAISFGMINRIFCHYISIMKKIGEQNSLDQIRENILTAIKILPLKNRISFLVIHFAQFSQQGIFDQNSQQQTIHQILWIFRSMPIMLIYAFKFLKALCLKANNSQNYMLQKLYIYYIMQDNYRYFLQSIHTSNVEFQTRIISILWNQRFIEFQGSCLYFKFIFSLCKYIVTGTNNLKPALKNFFKIIILFLIKYIDKSQQFNRQFFQFNSQYLLSKKSNKLISQLQLSVIYFTIILPQQKRYAKTPKQYYIFIWSHFHKFSYVIRQFLNIYAFRSFLNNQILYDFRSKRRIFHLSLKIQKMRLSQFFYRLSLKQTYVKQLRSKLSKLRKKVGKNNRKYKLIMEHIFKYYTISV